MSARLLNNALLASPGETVAVLPAPDRASLPVSIVHIGPGAFHRAHQADAFDRLNATDPRWGICGVSLHSTSVRDALAPQDGLYTLVTLDEQVSYRVIGALKEVLHASDPGVLDRMTAATTRIISLTVTEKGYCLGVDGRLDMSHPDIAHDRATPEQPLSAIGWLTLALSRRKAGGAGGLNIVSCDNQPGNGDKLKAAVLALAEAQEPGLAAWIAAACWFPSTMVDSITPATDDALRARVRDEAGLDDAWPIQREAFTSWVIETNVSPDFPDLASVGVVMTSDVGAHERAKLRLLNGAHSTLAYLGLAYGYDTVARAMADHDLSLFIRDMMRNEIAPSLTPPDGLDLDAYIASLLDRFANPAIAHKLSQIAWDGSQKLPIRLLDTISDNLGAGRLIAGLCVGVAAWIRFVRRQHVRAEAITDPMADKLLTLAGMLRDDAPYDVTLFARRSGVVPQALADNTDFIESLEAGYRFVMGREIQQGQD